jgi:hypothetical protein
MRALASLCADKGPRGLHQPEFACKPIKGLREKTGYQ